MKIYLEIIIWKCSIHCRPLLGPPLPLPIASYCAVNDNTNAFFPYVFLFLYYVIRWLLFKNNSNNIVIGNWMLFNPSNDTINWTLRLFILCVNCIYILLLWALVMIIGDQMFVVIPAMIGPLHSQMILPKRAILDDSY